MRKGWPQQYLQGHHIRLRIKVPPEKLAEFESMRQLHADGHCPYDGEGCDYLGLCHCGCGDSTNTVVRNNYKYSHLKGLPFKYISGHQSRVLTQEEVREIRYLYGTTGMSQAELAKKFNVSQVTISKIALFDRWKDAGVKTEEEEGH